jgi:hypothetical protein
MLTFPTPKHSDPIGDILCHILVGFAFKIIAVIENPIFMSLKRSMDTEKTDLNLTPAETDSAQTNESVEIRKSENRVGEGPSYMRSRQIALKKFTPPEGEPS